MIRSLDDYLDPPTRSQDPEFVSVQVNVRVRNPEVYDRLSETVLRLALEGGPVRQEVVQAFQGDGSSTFEHRFTGGVTADDVMDEADPLRRLPSYLIGCVIGTLRSRHRIRVGCGGAARDKARHPAAKGRWINRYELTVEALRDPPEITRGAPSYMPPSEGAA